MKKEERKIGAETYELAKQKGFDWIEMVECDNGLVELEPTQSLLQQWMRDVKFVSVLPEHGKMQDDTFGYFTRVFTDTRIGSAQFKVFEYKNSYEEALEMGLLEGLNSIS